MAAAVASHVWRPWPGLPDGVLHEIASRLLANFVDLLRFGAVCRSWKTAAAAAAAGGWEGNPRLPRAPSLPFLTCHLPPPPHGDPFADDYNGSRCFYSLVQDRVYYLNNSIPGESRSWYCWGSSHGWLAMVDTVGGSLLFNPLSGARVDLPPLTTLPQVARVMKMESAAATSFIVRNPFGGEPGGEGVEYTVDQFQQTFPRKLALSSSPTEPGCIAMAIVSGLRTLAYTRPGDASWVHLATRFVRCEDVIYHRGRFYAVPFDGDTVAIDFRSGRRTPAVEVFAPELPLDKSEGSTRPDRMYLVTLPSSGDFLQVIRYVLREDGVVDDPYWSRLFEVFRLVVVGTTRKQWVRQERIGQGCSLFLGYNHSIALPAVGMRTCEADCIYYSDDLLELSWDALFGGHDIGVFVMERMTCCFFCPFPSLRAEKTMPSPMWIEPRK